MNLEKPLQWKPSSGEKARLAFRKAKVEEARELKALYEEAWGSGITIERMQIVAMIENFPDGQIVGVHPESGLPASMINIMLSGFEPEAGFTAGYGKATGERTFSTHVPMERILEEGKLPVALCVSIAVAKKFSRNGYALETLSKAIEFAESAGAYAVPYSAPRAFASAREKNPAMDIETYLHLTVPSGLPYERHIERVRRLSGLGRVGAAFRKRSGASGILEVSEQLYSEYQAAGTDPLSLKRGDISYFRFFAEGGEAFFSVYGRYPHIEDFCMLTGRRPMDPVMRLHVENGARFIRDGSSRLSGVFEGSRPEDVSALGYNVLLTYGYHPLLGQDYL